MDQHQYLNNYAPPLTNNSQPPELGLMLGQGRGRCAVAQTLTLIQKEYLVKKLSDPIFRKKYKI